MKDANHKLVLSYRTALHSDDKDGVRSRRVLVHIRTPVVTMIRPHRVRKGTDLPNRSVLISHTHHLLNLLNTLGYERGQILHTQKANQYTSCYNEMFKLALANASRHVLLHSCYESYFALLLSMNNAMGKLQGRGIFCTF